MSATTMQAIVAGLLIAGCTARFAESALNRRHMWRQAERLHSAASGCVAAAGVTVAVWWLSWVTGIEPVGVAFWLGLLGLSLAGLVVLRNRAIRRGGTS